MTRYVALLRAVNVGGRGKLPMETLRQICTDLGFAQVSTYIQSGNVVFGSDLTRSEAGARLEAALSAQMGHPATAILREGAALGQILAKCSFVDAAPNKVAVLFLPSAPSPAPLERAKGLGAEEIICGASELYIHYPDGMGRSRLRLPDMEVGTARNLNTLRKLSQMI